MKISSSTVTHFINVDLDIYSAHDLQPLVKHLGKKVFVLRVGLVNRQFCAHLEIAKHTKTADSTIRAFCKLLKDLPDRERSLWDTATIRSFSIGIQAGARPNPRDFTIRPSTVKAISDLDAQIVLTIYPSE